MKRIGDIFGSVIDIDNLRLAFLLSVYEASPGRVLPIGDLTSQHLANLYLDPLDRMARTNYVRYMDDFIFWSDDKSVLRRLMDKTVPALSEALGLSVKEPILNRTAHGMDFLGMWIFPWRVNANRRSRDRYRRRLKAYDHLFRSGVMDETVYQNRITALTAYMQKVDTLTWRKNYFGGRRETSGSNRQMRGGSYNNNASNCALSYRNNNNPSNENDNGFRLACSAAPQEHTAVPFGNQSLRPRGEYIGGSLLVGVAEGHEPPLSYFDSRYVKEIRR